jgi:HSP20 family protein
VRGERRSDRADDTGSVLVRELRYGSFKRTFALPEGVTADDVAATYDKGLLTVRVNGASAAGEGARKIAIQSAEPAAAIEADADADADAS